MGFLPLFITRPGSTYQFPRDTDHGPSSTAHGPIKMNCVPIVARLRQKLGVAMVSRFAFYAILGVAIGVAICLGVSRFLKRCDRMSRLWTECRTFVGYIRMILMYRDTWRQNRDTFFRIKRHRDTFATLQVSRCFGQLERLYQCF